MPDSITIARPLLATTHPPFRHMREVVLVYRKPSPTAHSIEYLFHNVFSLLRSQIPIREVQLHAESTGLVNRISNTLQLLPLKNKIVHLTGDCYYAILGALFAKRVITIHDISFLDRTRGVKRAVLKLFWVTLPVHFSHRITVVSKETKEALMRETNVQSEKIKVIYNFIDPIYQPVNRRFNSQCPRILQVGTDFNKNLINLAAALKGTVCHLVVIGRMNAEQTAAFDAAGISYENHFSIPIAELHRHYVQADMLTFVSTVEGFGMPILEAQATGLPVITSNCSSMPEVAADGALLVDPFNPQAIRHGILELIGNEVLRARLIGAGYVNTKRFSKESIAADYQSVYESCSD